jgi:hypothetical protein
MPDFKDMPINDRLNYLRGWQHQRLGQLLGPCNPETRSRSEAPQAVAAWEIGFNAAHAAENAN